MSAPADRYRPIHAVLGGLILMTLCAALFVGVKRRLLFAGWDQQFKVQLQSHAAENPGPRAVFTMITELASWKSLMLEGLAGLLAFAAGRRWRWCGVWGAGFLGFPVVMLIKTWFGRPRPVFDDPLVITDSLSYPSAHAAGAVLVFGGLLYLLPEKWPGRRPTLLVLLLPLILAIGFSRVYLGAHWFSDVLGGYLFGAGWLLLAAGAVNQIARRKRAAAGLPQ